MGDQLHPDLDALAGALWDQSELSSPIVFLSEGEPPDYVRKLMDTLGVTVEVVPVPVRSSPRSSVNKQVRVGDGVGGEIVVLGAWCPTCKQQSTSNGHGDCIFCGTRIVDEDSLSSRAMRDQIETDKIRPVEAPQAPEPPDSAVGDDGSGTASAPVGTGDDTEGHGAVRSSDGPVDGAKKTTRPAPWSTGRRWDRDRIIAAIKEFGREHGRAPTADEWRHVGETTPNYSAVVKHCGSWADAIEAAGFPRPKRGGYRASSSSTSSEAPKQEERQQVPVVWLVKVPRTGLRYRTADEALVAADEVEHDGERVAREARVAGQEGKADQAIDAARALAEKIRVAARTAGATISEPEPAAQTASTGTASHASPGPAGAVPEPGSGSECLSEIFARIATAVHIDDVRAEARRLDELINVLSSQRNTVTFQRDALEAIAQAIEELAA